jgi:hypothetical protein
MSQDSLMCVTWELDFSTMQKKHKFELNSDQFPFIQSRATVAHRHHHNVHRKSQEVVASSPCVGSILAIDFMRIGRDSSLT